MDALAIKGLSKNFGAVEVLKELSLNVAQGEHVAVIGPNGAGKSTLLNIISGDLRPDAGHVCLLGRDVTRLSPYRRVHHCMARSYQLTRVFPSRTVLQNTLLALQGKRRSRFQMARSALSYQDLLAKAEHLLTLLGLWEKRDQLASQVSYGDRRKMEIALSLALEPRILLLDEPSAGLDLGEIHDFIALVRNLSKDITVLFAAHDMDVVFGLADRVVVLYYGQFIADGTPEAIKTDPKVRAIYLGMM
jgi:branched-chain amino acid transport system ATP-binding protein